MKKETIIRIAICLLFFALIAWLCACVAEPAAGDFITAPVEFTVISSAGLFIDGGPYRIVRCEQTGVLYAASENGGLTLLVNQDGSPMFVAE